MVSKATPSDATSAQTITPEELATWWNKNVVRFRCPDAEALATLASAIDDFRLVFADFRTDERARREATERARDKVGQRFKQVIRERLDFWSKLHAELLEYESKISQQHGRCVPDHEAARSEPVQKLTELLKLIEDTYVFWNGPPVRARSRQVRADWHLSARHLNSRIAPIWGAAGLRVSYGPGTIYARFLAFAVCRAEGRANIRAESVQAAFPRVSSKENNRSQTPKS
jgi:hypothetical protein